MNAGRYHLTLTASGRPVMHGWWNSESVARAQVSVWIGSWGDLPEARIELTDEETGRRLAMWPQEP